MTREFLRAGHLPTLFASFLYFDLSFMVWVLLAPLSVLIARDLHLNAGHKGLMVAVPVLAGAVIRVVAGVFADVFKPRLTGCVMQAIVVVGLIGAWAFALDSFGGLLALGPGAFAALSLAALAAVANVGIRWRHTRLAQPAVSWSAPR